MDESKRGDRNINVVAYTPSAPLPFIFRASFAREAIETNVIADEGADDNFISATLLNNNQQELGSIEIKSLNPPQLFRGLTKTRVYSTPTPSRWMCIYKYDMERGYF